MKTKTLVTFSAVLTLLSSLVTAAPLGTAFTYQGRLADGGVPAQGLYDLRFVVFDAAQDGSGISGVLTNAATPVANGLFTVTLDFGSGVFTGDARWLEIGVRTNGGAAFAPLAPRQPLTPAPHALFAPNAGTASSAATALGVANNAVTSPGIASGQVVKSLNGLKDVVTLAAGANLTLTPSGQILTLSTPTDWHLGGNSGTTPGATFLGTTDTQPLELKVNGQRALRLEPTTNSSDAANLIAGHSANSVSPGVVGASIGGGGTPDFGHLGMYNYPNRVTGDYGTVGGGAGNTSGATATIGGGYGNGATNASVVAGGMANTADGTYSAIGGGQRNHTVAWQSTIAGGAFNRTDGEFATIGGGQDNTIWANASHAVIGAGHFNTIAANAESATISGGESNRASAPFASVGGGAANQAMGPGAFVGGGGFGGGFTGTSFSGNTASGTASTVAGGYGNTASGPGAFVGGGGYDGMNSLPNHASGPSAVIGGGFSNNAANAFAAISGGAWNSAEGYASAIGGGQDNRTLANFTTVTGGQENSATNQWATVGGGFRNLAGGEYSFAAGRRAKALHTASFVWADSTDAEFVSTGDNQFLIRAIGGVGINTASPLAMLDVAGGDALVRGPSNFLPGTDARLNLGDGNNCVRALWGEGLRFNVWEGTDALAIKNGGTVGIGTTSPGARLHVASAGGQPQLFLQQTATEDWARLRLGGAGLFWDISVRNANEPSINFWNGAANAMVVSYFGTVTATAFNPTSDRAAKENFTPVDSARVLEKVVSLPIAHWNFKQETGVQHVGPMAQDFHAAFGVGTDDRHIATVDADGVALAAIQGLNEKVEVRSQKSEASIRDLEAKNATLEKEVAELKALVETLAAKVNGGGQ